MATLILSAVGTAVGGPVGGAIGALIGQQADAAIFAPRARTGPRLGELSVQTSSYGSFIPKIFGRMRVAGTVIWASDLKERRSESGGGKGRADTIQYSYFASFAVALSGRPVREVRRIWADGKLLRGAGGDFKSATGFRLYEGSEEQEADPLIASIEGMDKAPAFRGIAYAMFEDLELADFGNRIPSLTFELVADEEPVAIGAIAEVLGQGAVAAGATGALAGFAASGDSVRGALEALDAAGPLSLLDDGEVLTIGEAAGEPVTIGAAEAGAVSAALGGRSEFVRRAADAVPGAVSIAYHDPARDYQTGLQRAATGSDWQRTDEHALPAVVAADEAKAMAERRLAALCAGRATATVHLAWRSGMVRPGRLVRIEGQSGTWKVQRWTMGPMLTTLELVRVAGGSLPVPVASPGRPVSQPDLEAGATVLHLFDLPIGDRAMLHAFAAGESAGWRRAALSVSYDGGMSWASAGATAAPATMGWALAVPGDGQSALLDLRGSVEVELLNEAMWLESRSDEALAGGANLAVLGEELIQFGSAVHVEGKRFRLSRLLRGRRGTEWACGSHQTGEPFVLIEGAASAAIEPPQGAVGAEARLVATGIGDPAQGTEARALVRGSAMLPPSPVHLWAARGADGSVEIGWTRRSRSGWGWTSGSDTPLGEEREAYRLELSGDGFARSVELETPYYRYTAAEQAADGMAGAMHIEVVQRGTHGLSKPATFSFN